MARSISLGSRIRIFASCSVLAILFCSTAPHAGAQLSQATIQGIVKDASGATVPSASVTVTDTDTNELRSSVTGDDGAFRIPGLQPGHYTVRVEKSGFKTGTETGLTLDVAQQLVVNPILEVGATSQQVVVTGEAPVVNTTSSSLGGLVNDQSISDLPLNGRNFIDLSLLQPGVSRNTNQGTGGGQSGTWFSSNGAPTRSNWISIDGAPMINQLGGATGSEGGTTLGVDGIKEFRVITNSFSADYGMTMGSQMVILSKGGTNQFHGDVFEYIRNSVLDSRNYFDTLISAGKNQEGEQRRLPPFQRNNFGGSFGGPIKKDKTFFYAVYEGLRQDLGVTASDTVFPAACHQFVSGTSVLVNPGGCATGLTSAPVPAVVLPILALYPLPNNGTSTGFVYPAGNILNEDFGQIRFDQNLSTADSFFARYTIDNAKLSNGSGNLVAVSSIVGNSFPEYFALTSPSRNQFLTIAENHVFSATLLNTARLSFSRTNYSLLISATPNTFGPGVSFVTGNPIGMTQISGLSNFGTPIGDGPNPPNSHLQNIYTFSDDIFYSRGKHAYKFGVLINRFNQGIGPVQEPDGQIQFSGIANFMKGIYANYTAQTSSLASTYDFLYNTFGFYVQDDYRATSRLTLNVGLRYEFNTDPYELDGRQYSIRNIRTDATPTPGPIIDDRSYYNFSPRLGFAYDLRGDGKTAIRGGFGLYYDVGNIGNALYQGLIADPPLENQGTALNSTNAVLTLPFVFPAGSANLHTIDYHVGQPHVLQYNLTVERQLPGNAGLSVSYVGSRGINLYSEIEENPFVPSSFSNGVPVWDPYICGGVLSAYQPTGVSCAANPAYHRVNPAWSSSIVDNTNSASWYNALQIVGTKRLSKGFQFQAAYTYAKSLDYAQGQGYSTDCSLAPATASGENPFNPKFDKGPSCFDLRNNFRLSTLYYFPKIKSNAVVSKIVNGWWAGTIVSAQSGYPFSPNEGNNRALSGLFTGQVIFERPNVNTAASIAASPCTSQPGQPAAGNNPCAYTPVPYNKSTVKIGSPNEWFNPAMFSLQPIGTLGNSERGLLTGPALVDWDLSLAKDTSVPLLGEKGNVEFRADFFNLLNHTNFAMQSSAGVVFAGNTTGGDAGSYSEPFNSTVGKLGQTASNARQIQFALKVIF